MQITTHEIYKKINEIKCVSKLDYIQKIINRFSPVEDLKTPNNCLVTQTIH